MIPKLARAHALGIRETFNVEPFKQNVFPVANDLKILRGAMRPDFILLWLLFSYISPAVGTRKISSSKRNRQGH